jgi:hypothetical protein
VLVLNGWRSIASVCVLWSWWLAICTKENIDLGVDYIVGHAMEWNGVEWV